LHDLFRLEHYSDLAVIPHGGEFIPKDPRIKPILEDWITQISQLFPSPFFHIGFDETWLLETGAKKLNESPEKLYLEMLKQTTDIVEKQGKIPMVWADMLQKYPLIIPKISKNIIAVAWHYSPLSESMYKQMLSPFSKAGIKMQVQSAILNWSWIVPAFERSFQNTDALVQAGKKYNAIGFINSGWTDDTQVLMRLGFPDFAYGSAASWQSGPVDQKKFFKNYANVLYSQPVAGDVEKAYESLKEAESLIRKSVGETIPAFWANPFSAKSLKMIENNKENLHNGRLAAEDAQIYIRRILKSGIDSSAFFTLLVGARMLDYLALKYLYAGEIVDLWKKVNENPGKKEGLKWFSYEVSHKYHTRTSDMMDAIIEIKGDFQKAWLNEYTPFRLGIALGKYDLEFQFWLKFQRRLENLNYLEGDVLPSLESLVDIEY